MKKIESLAVLLGIAVIFGGTVTVLAGTTSEEKPENNIETVRNTNKKVVNCKLDYVFNDGSMDRNFYENKDMPKIITQMQVNDTKNFNEICDEKCFIAIADEREESLSSEEGEKIKDVLFKNKTNEIHGMGLFFKAYATLNELESKGFKTSNEIKDEILDFFATPCKNPIVCLNKILTPGTQVKKLSGKSYEVFKKIFELKDVELNKETFENSKKDLLNRMNMAIDEINKMAENIVITSNLKKDALKDISKNEELKGKVLVNNEETAKKIKNSNTKIVNLIEKNIEKIKELDFETVKNTAKTLEWRNSVVD